MSGELTQNKMKAILLLLVTCSLAYADPSTTSAGSTETSSKAETKTPNSLTAPAAPAQGKTQYYSARAPTFVQLVQKPLFNAHGGIPQQAMLIIAQPALLPHNLVYNQASSQHAQQLLNYFHSNPAAKYQLLYNYQPQHQAQQSAPSGQGQGQGQGHGQAPVYYATSPQGYQNYQYLTPQQYTYLQPSYHTPQYQIPSSTYTHLQLAPQSQSQHQGTSEQQQPFIPSQQISPSLSHSLHQVSSQLHTQFQPSTHSQLQLQAQTQAQPQSHSHTQSQTQPQHQHQHQHPSQSQYSSQYYSQGPQTFTTQTPLKSVAPIITGLENFTPEQQAQIKEQLSSHFGGLTQINSNSLQANHPDYQTKFRIEVQSPESDYASSQPSQAESNHKAEAREEQPHQQHQQHQPHYLTQGQQPVYTYRTPQYTKG